MAHPHKHESDRNKDARVHKIAGKGAMVGIAEKAVRKGIREHDAQLHGNARTTLKFANGGAIPGRAAGGRLDKPSRHHKGGKKGTTVNVLVAGHGAPATPPMPAMPPAGMNMAPPPMARPPMAAPVMPPPGMMARKKGGRVKYTGGAADGVGRMEKVENYGKKARQIAPENR